MKIAPDDSRIHSDLGTALLEIGNGIPTEDSAERLRTFARSLEHFNKAIERDTSLREALFNRALVYQQLLLPRQAADDWRKYLEVDPKSRWADEARQNLRRLEEQGQDESHGADRLYNDYIAAYRAGNSEGAWRALGSSRSRRGNTIVNRLLDEHLATPDGGREAEAGGALDALLYAGKIEAENAGDRFTLDLWRVYAHAVPDRRLALAQARRVLKAGYESHEQSRLEEALAYYGKAKEIFARNGDACEATYVDYPLGHCHLLRSEIGLALSAFERLAQAATHARYGWLLGQAHYATANALMHSNDYSAAVESSNRFFEISAQIEDVDGTAKALDQLAQEYLFLNDYRRSLGLSGRSLALQSRRTPEPMQRWQNYSLIALPLHSLGFRHAALEFQKEALRAALTTGRPQVVARSYINLGLMHGSLGDHREAVGSIEIALAAGRQLPSDSVRAETVAYASLQLGRVHLQRGAFGDAVASYDEAVRLYDELGHEAFSYAAHKGRLLACIARGECPGIEEETETTLNLFERHRARILEESNRNVFFDTEQNVYDAAIDHAYSKKNNSLKAFEYAERSRARSLLDMTDAGVQATGAGAKRDLRFTSSSLPRDLAALQRRLPEHAQVLQYAVLDDKVLVWIMHGAAVWSRMLAIDRQELSERVLDYLRHISHAPTGDIELARRDGAALYELLISPIESLLDKRKHLSIVPDKILNHLPFSSLVSPASHRYLVEEYSLSISPSSNLFVVSSEAARGKENLRRELLLSVGDPGFDRREFSTLAGLPSARREAEAVAALYPARVLVGDEATEDQVADEMREANVVHFAAHYVVDEQAPLRSAVVLAQAGDTNKHRSGDDGMLSVHELYGLKLPETRLVVLSACKTGVERYYGGEGMIGAARPFIAIGVPLVVASLWSVDSEATAELMIVFHRNRKQHGLSTVESLRRAQMRMLDDVEGRYRHPYYWASFTSIGGYASF